MTAPDATFVATVSLVGVGLGAAPIGPRADRSGRRGPLMACVLVFSVFTLLLPLVPSVALLGLVRFVAGLGLGGCVPVAVTMMQEASAADAQAHSSTTTMTGYHVGAVAASPHRPPRRCELAPALLRRWDPGPGSAVLPVLWARRPETHPVGAVRTAAHGSTARFGDLFRGRYLRTTLGLRVGACMGLLLVYGLNTWLPQLMRGAGYDVSDSLVLLLLLNAVVLVTGVFVFRAQVLLYGFVGYAYPREIVGTGMGMVSAVGRLGAVAGPWVTGLLVSGGIAYPFGFPFFARAALLGVLAVAAIPAAARRPAERLPTGTV